MVDTIFKTTSPEKKITLREVMDDTVLKRCFLDFCEKHWALETALLILEIELYKGLSSTADRKMLASKIYSTFIEDDSPFEVSLDFGVKHRLEKNGLGQKYMDETGGPLSSCFDEVWEQAFNELQSGLLTKWIKTESYDLAKKESKRVSSEAVNSNSRTMSRPRTARGNSFIKKVRRATTSNYQ